MTEQQIRRQPASWIIRNKATGAVMFETFNAKIIRLLNRAKYDAIPIGEYLASLNRR